MQLQTAMLIKSLFMQLREPSHVYAKLGFNSGQCSTDSHFRIRAVPSKIGEIIPVRANVLCAD